MKVHGSMEQFLAEVLDVLRTVEWAGDFCDEPACPMCLVREFKGSHSPDCRLKDVETELVARMHKHAE